jgi:Nif-specific regulatory protein
MSAAEEDDWAGLGDSAQVSLSYAPDASYKMDDVIGNSRPMQQVFAQVHLVAPTKSTVIIRGESGTGKELIARAVHTLSPRADGPFIKVNCAALPDTLLEAELFGHEKGAFTGATQQRKGRFELAHGGTLFLDEIGDISSAFQAKLLRVLQEREFERVGGTSTIRVDVRIVCATNRNLEEAVAREDFRADLYYRINVVPIFVPALRERRQDIPDLAKHFLRAFNRENERSLRFSESALRVISSCNYPGNVRELENCVYRAATMTRGDHIDNIDLPCQSSFCHCATLLPETAYSIGKEPETTTHSALDSPADWHKVDGLEDLEALPQRERLVRVMERAGWVQAKAARMLGMTPRQIGYALRKHNVEIKRL